jgi:two-component system, OmpR family, phosphate regulon sensor histidine kinase PhoR
MHKYHISYLIIIMTIAMISLIAVQMYWINSAFSIKNEELLRTASIALQSFALKLEKQETLQAIKSSKELHKNNKDSVFKGSISNQGYTTNNQKIYKETNILESNDIAESYLIALKSQGIIQRISYYNIHEIIQSEFLKLGILAPFYWGIIDTKKSNIVYIDNSASSDKLIHSILCVQLFPHDILASNYRLSVIFPETQAYIIDSLSIFLLGSAACILLIMGIFSISVTSLLKQKKLSKMKADFIDNMTHEFQTPLATISLASEALRDQDILESELTRNRFLDAIHKENSRLSKHVDLILQAATLEDKSIPLTLESVNIHEILELAINKQLINIQNNGGKINSVFLANHSTIHGDSHHLFNVFTNLLDNACKFSKDIPDITIKTENTKFDILIQISDKGIGIKKEDYKKIFDRFYRINTSNRHDVKGFGLGLSYVDSIVTMHKGSVSIQSHANNGSTFSIKLPL